MYVVFTFIVVNISLIFITLTLIQNNKHIVAIKSKTLPESTYTRHGKHQRSLSDAKTTDVISIIGGMHHQNRVRYISCTDSNTSGVSSCESVPGRAAIAG